MPVEIRELVIQTNIVSPARTQEAPGSDQLALLKQQIVQECLKAIKDKAPRNGLDR
ncbi:DUF5908 family protein [Massilia agilis]|uniref:DUF5908 family protein n=2 Tax=Massilia TaxID=149698 RepID=A0ABT2BPL1_9BURK|nr:MULTISPECIES: DUF5908 family protein [Massilia]MCS0610336.1 DUF5908 family protein [Massilia solisilvae]MCS0810464.1 DUF5908 family protein [Massilia agilis]